MYNLILEMSISDISAAISAICDLLRKKFSIESRLDMKSFIDTLSKLFSLLNKKDSNFKSNNVNDFKKEWITVFIKLRIVLNCEIPFVNTDNMLTKITLNTLIDFMSAEHYHQNVKTDNIRTMHPIKKHFSASCSYHKESLLDHSLMAMFIAIDNALGSTQNLLLVALTALFHDVGKPSCIALFGQNIGYPFHGEYGACILSQFFSDEIARFKKFISKKQWEVMCRAISVHRCSYDTTKKDEWSEYRRTLAQLETHHVKLLSKYLAMGDTFGKVSDPKHADTDDFISSRRDYNKTIGERFDTESFMKKNNKKTLCFFLRGKSGNGKTTFGEELIKFLLANGFKLSQLVNVSRDEIMASVTATRINHKLSKPRPDGKEYEMLYNVYKEKKLSKIVNDEMKMRISNAIIQGKIPIVDSCILYYDHKKNDFSSGITACIPNNISNAFIIAIDCVRNTVFTEKDAYKNGMSLDTLCKTRDKITPINWISTKSMCIEKLASISTNSNKPDTLFIPHLTFSYGFNEYHSIGWDIFTQTVSPIIEYFANSLKSEDTSKMNIIQFINYLNDNFGIEGLCSSLAVMGYRTANSHGNLHVIRMNYLEHNQNFIDLWSRQIRGIIFMITSTGKLLPIKYLLQRGAEMITNKQLMHGITSTESIDFGDNDESHDEKISNALSSILHLDKIQQETITNLLLNRNVDMNLSFKKDGSLLGYTIFHDKEVIEFMRKFIENSNDKFAQKILQICDSLGIPFGVFSSQSTLLIGENMLDWTVQALLSTIMNDDEISLRFNSKTYMDAVDECFPQILLNLTNLIHDVSANLNIPSDASTTISMESICRFRRSIFALKDHTELALSYQSSSCTVLSISYCNSLTVKSIPHFIFSEFICKYRFIEPCFWKVTHTTEVNSLLDDLNAVIFEKMSISEFFAKNKPHNKYENFEYIIDREGFVSYTGDTFDYGKIKTDAYYIAHKLKAKNIGYLGELAKIPSARQSFPLCNEVSTFYSKIEDDINSLIRNFMLIGTSTLFNGFSDKAKNSFPNQTPEVRLKMLINSPDNDTFLKVALEVFSSVYPYNPERVDAEFTNDVNISVKSILMSFAEKKITFDDPLKNVKFANLFCVVPVSYTHLTLPTKA